MKNEESVSHMLTSTCDNNSKKKSLESTKIESTQSRGLIVLNPGDPCLVESTTTKNSLNCCGKGHLEKNRAMIKLPFEKLETKYEAQNKQ